MTGLKRSSELFNAGNCDYYAFMRANKNSTERLAQAIIDEDGECGVPQGLAAILGIDPTRDDSKYEESAITVNNNPLGRLALFDGNRKLYAIGMTSEQPLVTKLDYVYANVSIKSRRLTVAAQFNWAMMWNPIVSDEPELLPEHLNPVNILNLQNDCGTIFESSYVKTARRVADAADAFGMLHAHDTHGAKIISAFFEELVVRAAQPAPISQERLRQPFYRGN